VITDSVLAELRRRLGHKSIALLGDTNVDVVLDIDGLPAPGGDALATSQTVGVGGSATNTAVLLHRLGADVQLLSSVGDDPWSVLAREALTTEGVGVGHITTVLRAGTSLNVVAVTPDGERTMLACRGASALLTAAHIPDKTVASSAWLHLSGYALLEDPQRSAAVHALDVAAASGVPSSMDLPVGPSATTRDVVLEAIRGLHLIVLGVPEALQLLGDQQASSSHESVVDALHRLGPTVVALKLGAAGAVLSDGRSVIQVPSVSVTPLDTTGAGDAFSAGMVAGLAAGLSLEETGALATLSGAAAVLRRGAGRNMPSINDLRRLSLSGGGADRRSTTMPSFERP
jgi:ribokinase